MRWLRYFGWALGAVLVLFLAGLVATWGVARNSKSIGELYLERSASNLTAAACLKNKGQCVLADAPIGAWAEYRRCGGPVAGSRIKGEPLACSQRLLTDSGILSDWTNPGQSIYRQLRRGCRKHDLCYRHGKATFGLDRDQCDREFLAESLRECWLIYGNENAYWWLKDRDILRWACQARASAAYLAVSQLGRKNFEYIGPALCEYESGPHAVRDHVVAGRFLGGERDYVISLSLTPDQGALAIKLLSFGADGQSREEAALDNVLPQNVAVGDRDWACQRRRTKDGGFSADCPENLGQSLFKRPADWLRFAPVVFDSDGDGSDELIVPSLTPDFGLVFTHIRAKREGAIVTIEPPRAYLGVARMAQAVPGEGGCEDMLEFADCRIAASGAGATTPAPILSGEAALQNAGFQLTAVASAEAGCLPEGRPDKQDVMLLSAFSDLPKEPTPELAEKRGWLSDYVLRRFIFDPQTQRWQMRRDRFNNDRHRLAGCNIRASRDQFQTHARIQYPPLAVRVPSSKPKDASPVGAPKCAPDERLALISRDKCPTTTPVARAGNLNDIDLMLYKVNARYSFASDQEKVDRHKADKGYDDLRMANAEWRPILWSETADPVLTSRAAREADVAMVATFIGGTQWIGGVEPGDAMREGHHPVIAVLRADTLRSPKEFWEVRHADTMGHVPDLYGVYKSSKSAAPGAVSERRANLWDPRRFGSARIYFQIPSLLGPFTAAGGKGLSLVYFANRELWAEQWAEHDADEWAREHKSKPLPIAEGRFRLLIVPIPAAGAAGNPAMLDCPMDALAKGSAEPAARGRGYAHFLRREPVLAGKFYDGDTGGSLAVAWRDVAGGIKLTAVRYDDRKWKFGAEECAPPRDEGTGDLLKSGEVYRERLN